ncbi:MAG: rod shape-determining protein MreD [Bacillota bacterium]|nr:rod shape-determining protein MreD [Bacillota bacterium]
MRIPVTALIIVLNFILQTTLFRLLTIQGIFPNTALIIVTSYALLRGSKEGALAGCFTGLLMDIFFSSMIGFYTLLYLAMGLFFGRIQKNYYRENYLLPVIFCIASTLLYQTAIYVTGFLFRGDGNLLHYLLRILLPEIVYTAIATVPIYRLLFAVNEWLELKEKYKYRLF